MTLIKLIRKYLFISILIVFVIGCISHFLIFRFFIHYSSDQTLEDQKAKIENYIAQHDTLPLAATLVLKPARIEETQIQGTPALSDGDRFFRDTMMYSAETGMVTPYRQLFFVVTYKDELHLINLNQPTMIPNDLFYAIVSSLLILLVLLLLFTYIIEYLLKRNIWEPLNYNLQKLHEYDLKAHTSLALKNPGIREFDEINEMIQRMVNRINEDYENSRIFTEDTSHEMQTPLSIIKSKMDLLMQNPSLMEDKENERSIQAISRAVSRLSKLNKSLLLITRINNNQYDEKQTIRLDKQLEDYLADLGELFETKNLDVKATIKPCELLINPVLVEILLSNLLSNAIRHNHLNGRIEIRLDLHRLAISNTYTGGVSSADLFNRLIRRSDLTDSTGLGLHIVKSICDKNGLQVSYNYPEENVFCIEILFDGF